VQFRGTLSEESLVRMGMRSTWNSSIWPLIALAWVPWAFAQTVDACGGRELSTLSLDQVTLTRVDHGFFEGDLKYSIRCGQLAAEAFHNKAGARIALMIEMDPLETVPAVSAGLAARLYFFPLKRLLTSASQPAAEFSMTVRNYVELEERMAGAARKSRVWDGRRGRPSSGTAAGFVKELLNAEQLYPEVAALARQLGYRARVSDVEEVRICQRFPCGALVTFQLYR
jgi:hypothetical protein